MAPSLANRLVPYLLALLLAVGLGWLFWSHSEGSAPRDEIRAVVKRSLTTDRPADCTKLYTRRFLEQTTSERGPAALSECRQEADGDPDATGVEVRAIRIEGGRARTTVLVRGREMDGTKLRLTLVDDALGWKLHRLNGIDVDLSRFRRAQVAAAATEGFPVSEARCMVRRLTRALGERGIERAMLTGSDRPERMGVGCVSPATIRRSLARDLAREDIPPPIARCILGRILSGRSAEEMRAIVRASGAEQRKLGTVAAASCARALGLSPA